MLPQHYITPPHYQQHCPQGLSVESDVKDDLHLPKSPCHVVILPNEQGPI